MFLYAQIIAYVCTTIKNIEQQIKSINNKQAIERR